MITIDEFIKGFADQFEETDFSEFSPETDFRHLDEWESLIGLGILNMIQKKCDVVVSPAEFRSCPTIQAVYELVASKAE